MPNLPSTKLMDSWRYEMCDGIINTLELAIDYGLLDEAQSIDSKIEHAKYSEEEIDGETVNHEVWETL